MEKDEKTEKNKLKYQKEMEKLEK